MVYIFGKRGAKAPFKFVQMGCANSVHDILVSPDQCIKDIPEKERYNLYFTAYHCEEPDPRNNFKVQQILPIDIDHVPEEVREKVADLVCLTLGIARSTTGIICSGYGLQVFIHLPTPIMSLKEIDESRIYYRALCERLQDALTLAGLPGKVDVTGHAKKKLLRVPNTVNRKEGRPDANSYVINSHMEQVPFNLIKLAGLPEVAAHEQISVKTFVKMSVDSEAVLNECRFLVHCKERQEEVSEPEWYAMHSIIGRLTDGAKLVHEYSKEHPSYTPEGTSKKLEQALAASGPRTCENINQLWGKCNLCRHYRNVTSPISIRGPDFIGTKDSGFYTITTNEKGDVTGRKPNYDDLAKYFKKLHNFVNIDIGGKPLTYTYNGTHWEDCTGAKIKAFAEDHFNPKPTEAMRSEFLAKIMAQKLMHQRWFETSVHKKINLRNGVYCLETKTLLEHSPDFGFKNVLDFDYVPGAIAPIFDKFLNDVTQNDELMRKTLLEYSGYCMSGDKNWAQQAIFLFGSGSNGKSTFVNVLKAISGREAYASVTLSSLDEPTMRQSLENKLFNISEETNPGALTRSESFKRIVTGENIEMKRLYYQPYSAELHVKLLVVCNTLPKVRDTSDGTFRRMLFVPFDAKFSEADQDPMILPKLIEEAPGIFNMIIAAYSELVERRQKRIKVSPGSFFTVSPRSLDVASEFREDSNDLEYWYQHYVVLNPEARLVFMDAYQAFQNYLERYKIRSVYTKMEFSAFMKDKKHIAKPTRVDGGTARVFRGIKLTDEAVR